MSSVDAAELAEAVAAAPSSGPETYLARRQIVAWQNRGQLPEDTDTQDAVRLYLGLKSLSNEPITLSTFKNMARTLTASTSLKKRVWLVPAANLEDAELRQEVSPFFVDRTTCDVPPGIDLADWYIIDQCCKRSRLGLGVMELEVVLILTQTMNIQPTPSSQIVEWTTKTQLDTDSTRTSPNTIRHRFDLMFK